jgi:carboxypeptidase D
LTIAYQPCLTQNTTFGGIMGFERRPQTEWFTDDGSFAGIVHQERNWTYVLVRGAGHQLPLWDPVAVRPTFIRPQSLFKLR